MPDLSTVYTISPSNESTLAVEVMKSGLLNRRKKQTLYFESFSGQMQFVAGDLAASQIQLTLDARSIVCRDAQLSKKEKKAVAEFARGEVLAADLYPEIRYASTCIRAKPLRGFVVTGTLQIRGTVAEVNVNMTWNTKRNNQFQVDGDATMRLSSFGLPAPSKMFGLMRTMDEIVVHLLLWAIPEPSTV
jgi:polyisoprenoid-binding protein YceI